MPKKKAAPPADADNDIPPVPPTDDEIRRRALLSQMVENERVQRDARTANPTLPNVKARPFDAARQFRNAFFRKRGIPNLVVWRGDVYTRWRGQWGMRSDADFDKLLHERLMRCMAEDRNGEAQNYQAPPAEFSALKSHIVNLSTVLEDRAPPLRYKPEVLSGDLPTSPEAWEPVDGRGWIATRGHLVNIVTWATLPGAEVFTPSCAEWEWTPDPHQPVRFLAYLDELGIIGPTRVMLREWIGYVLSGDTWAHKALMVIGPPRAGKSTLLDLIAYLVGPDANASPSLAELGKDFGVSMLLNKRLCTVTDASVASRTDVLAVVEIIKKLTGEDSFTMRRPYHDYVTAKLGARLMIGANESPHLYGGTKALANRFLFIELGRSFADAEQDKTLRDTLRAEAAGIVQWAGSGYADLLKRRYFTEPPESVALREEWYGSTEPVAEFAADNLVPAAGARVRSSDVYERYQSWCEAGGMKPLDVRALVKRLRTHLGAAVKSEQSHGIRYLTGVKLGDDPEL